MIKVTFYDWIFECDVEATREAYKKETIGGSEGCGCIYCQNFVVLRDKVFQGEILELLESLGVDYRKDAETYEVTLEKNKHLYGLWFHFIGKIIKKGNSVILNNNLKIDFFEKTDLRFDVFESKNLIQLEIQDIILPWVLEELPPE